MKSILSIFVAILSLLGLNHTTATPPGAFTDPAYGFSLQLPTNFSVYPANSSELATDTVRILVFESPQQQHVVQLMIVPFSGTLDKETAEQEPPLPTTTPLTLPLGDPALSFTASGVFGTDTNNVWFVHAGYLFEMMSAGSDESLLYSIAQSIRFN